MSLYTRSMLSWLYICGRFISLGSSRLRVKMVITINCITHLALPWWNQKWLVYATSIEPGQPAYPCMIAKKNNWKENKRRLVINNTFIHVYVISKCALKIVCCKDGYQIVACFKFNHVYIFSFSSIHVHLYM